MRKPSNKPKKIEIRRRKGLMKSENQVTTTTRRQHKLSVGVHEDSTLSSKGWFLFRGFPTWRRNLRFGARLKIMNEEKNFLRLDPVSLESRLDFSFYYSMEHDFNQSILLEGWQLRYRELCSTLELTDWIYEYF